MENMEKNLTFNETLPEEQVKDDKKAKELTFNETLTVEQFKAATLVSRIDIKRNPKTNTIFFSYGSKVGAVAANGIPTNPMVSDVTGSDGVRFWLLHEEGQGGAPVLASF